METILPISASVMAKSSAMVDKRPIGINSDVLNKKAAKVIPIKGSHSLIVSFSFTLSLIYYISFLSQCHSIYPSKENFNT